MSDILTDEIVKKLDEPPILKKKAILELIKESTVTIKKKQNFNESLRKALIETTVWTDKKIEEIHKARDYINTWKPEQLF